MPEIELSKIVYNDAERMRQNLDPTGIKELAESIKTIGLLNPIIIDRSYKLLAGRRRLEAYRTLERTEIPVSWFEDLDPITQKIVELDENRKRKQLDWAEEAKAVAEIHRLLSDKDRRHTATATAEKLGVSVGKVSEDLLLARGADNERVASRPSRSGALQTLKRERELELVRELARRRTSDLVSQDGIPSTQLGQGIVYHSDCLDVVRGLAPESIDLVVTDPPWGINFQDSSQWTTKWIMSYDDSPDIHKTIVELIPHLFRILKPGGHFYIFYPIQNTGWWTDTLGASGFYIRNRPLIWYKGQPSMSDVYTSFLPCYEAVIWGWKPGEGGFRRFFNRSIPEAFHIPRTDNKWHENEKPIDLIGRFIEASSDVNDLVFDPFAGGGSTAASAFGLGRYFITVEKDPINYDKAARRLRELEES